MGDRQKSERRPFVSTREIDGRALRYFREAQFLTLKELSAKSGVSYAQISRLETGESTGPRNSTLKHLADALGITPDKLVRSTTAETEANLKAADEVEEESRGQSENHTP